MLVCHHKNTHPHSTKWEKGTRESQTKIFGKQSRAYQNTNISDSSFAEKQCGNYGEDEIIHLRACVMLTLNRNHHLLEDSGHN